MTCIYNSNLTNSINFICTEGGRNLPAFVDKAFQLLSFKNVRQFKTPPPSIQTSAVITGQVFQVTVMIIFFIVHVLYRKYRPSTPPIPPRRVTVDSPTSQEASLGG